MSVHELCKLPSYEQGILGTKHCASSILGSTQPIQWVPGALTLGVKRPGSESDDSSPSGAEVKNAWSYISTPQYVFMVCA